MSLSTTHGANSHDELIHIAKLVEFSVSLVKKVQGTYRHLNSINLDNRGNLALSIAPLVFPDKIETQSKNYENARSERHHDGDESRRVARRFTRKHQLRSDDVAKAIRDQNLNQIVREPLKCMGTEEHTKAVVVVFLVKPEVFEVIIAKVRGKFAENAMMRQ